MDIKVLGTGCSKCKTLEKLTKEAASELDFPVTIEKVEDIYKIMSYGVMSTPALMIDQKVVVSGRVPSVAEIRELIHSNH